MGCKLFRPLRKEYRAQSKLELKNVSSMKAVGSDPAAFVDFRSPGADCSKRIINSTGKILSGQYRSRELSNVCSWSCPADRKTGKRGHHFFIPRDRLCRSGEGARPRWRGRMLRCIRLRRGPDALPLLRERLRTSQSGLSRVSLSGPGQPA